MGVRGEMFSTKVSLDNRTYFFNVKENRNGDVFMTVVESKPSEGEGFDRHQIVLFADDTREFLKGFEAALGFVEKELMRRRKAGRDRRSQQDRDRRSQQDRDRRPQQDREGRPAEAARWDDERGPRPPDGQPGKKVLRKKAPGGARASYADKSRGEGRRAPAKPSQAGAKKGRATVRSFKSKENHGEGRGDGPVAKGNDSP